MNAEMLAGYVPLDVRGTRGFACTAAAPWAAAALREHRTLRSWSRSGAPLPGGRATTRSLPAPVSGPERRPRWVCRPYHRGGAVAPLLGDRYLDLGEPRPFAELRAAVGARARGVRTPAVVAGAVYPAGPFYRADLVTEQVPGVRSLAEALFGSAAIAPNASVLLGAGRLVGSLERARVEHRDLNAGNILVPTEPFDLDFWVIDLDRCRVLPLDAPPPVREMRKRLERSLAKLARLHGVPWTDTAWEPLRAGYEGLQ